MSSIRVEHIVKKEVFYMKKLITSAAALALAAILAGCASNPPAGEPSPTPAPKEKTVETVEPVDESEVTQTAEYTEEYVSISVPLPDGWEFETVTDGHYSDGRGITFRKVGDTEHSFSILYLDSFGVCGTGLEERSADFSSGEKATVGCYSEQTWDFVYFYDAPGQYWAFNENGLVGEDAETALEIIGGAKVGGDMTTRLEAIEIACGGEPDDNAYARFDSEAGTWTVTLRDRDETTVTLDAYGNIL